MVWVMALGAWLLVSSEVFAKKPTRLLGSDVKSILQMGSDPSPSFEHLERRTNYQKCA